MAVMTIQLRCDPATGKKDIIIKLDSDADMLPHEHEQLHQQLVEKLLHGGVLTAADVGRVIVEREPAEGEASPSRSGQEEQRPAQAQGD